MRVMADLRCVQRGQTGIGRYALNLGRSLECTLGVQDVVALVAPGGQEIVARECRAVQAVSKSDFDLPDLVRAYEVDVFHSPLFLLPPVRPCIYVFTLHDVIPLSHPQFTHDAFRRFFETQLPCALRIASHVVSVSEYSRSQAIAHLKLNVDQITAVREPVDPRFLCAGQEPAGNASEAPFMLAVGAIDRRKNLTTLLEALCLLSEKGIALPQLYVVGGPSGDGYDFDAEIDRLGVRRLVKTLGWIDDDQLAALYRRASLLVFPSLCEGFGLPVIEAMASGTPVVASRATSIPEVAGEAAVLVDPQSPSAIAEGVERVLSDRKFADDLRRAGRERAKSFSIERHGRELVALYARLMARSA